MQRLFGHLHESASLPLQGVLGRGCVKTSARFHTSLFRSLLRGLRALRVEKIERNLALLDRLQNFAEFLHGLGRYHPFARTLANDRYLRIALKRMARPVCKGFYRDRRLNSLLQRIRPRRSPPGQDGDTRAPVLINSSASCAVFNIRLPERRLTVRSHGDWVCG
jgi:hypothetical protein